VLLILILAPVIFLVCMLFGIVLIPLVAAIGLMWGIGALITRAQY
jgi:hypothetical protein